MLAYLMEIPGDRENSWPSMFLWVPELELLANLEDDTLKIELSEEAGKPLFRAANSHGFIARLDLPTSYLLDLAMVRKLENTCDELRKSVNEQTQSIELEETDLWSFLEFGIIAFRHPPDYNRPLIPSLAPETQK